MALALVLSLVIFFLAYSLGGTLVDRFYMSDEAVHTRNMDTVYAFQQHIDAYDLTSHDTDEIARWTMAREDIYILLYKNQHLAFEAGLWDGKSTASVGTAELADMTNAAVYPVSFRDGVFQAVVYDFSDESLQTVILIVSVALACGVFAVMMLLYNRRITRAIISLSEDIRQIGRGQLRFELEAKGNDEIARLIRSVDAMRESILRKTLEESEARQKNSELITAMSHDIRNPLTALLGYLDLARADEYPSKPELQLYLDAGYEKAAQLKRLTDELFRYALVFGGGELPLNMQNYDAHILFEQLLAEQYADLQQHGIRVQGTLPELHCGICVDVLYLKRVLDNLFDNIRKYADLQSPVHVAAIAEDGWLSLLIANDIALEPRAVESNKIGLKTCEKIMAQMRGRFEKYEQDGRFCAEILLPIVPT